MRKENLLFLLREGYSLVALPLNLFSFATTTYYLLVENVPLLKAVFPYFYIYLAAGVFVGLPLIVVLGYVYAKSVLFGVNVRFNPYSYLLTPQQILIHRAVANLCKLNGLDVDAVALDELIDRSIREEFKDPPKDVDN